MGVDFGGRFERTFGAMALRTVPLKTAKLSWRATTIDELSAYATNSLNKKNIFLTSSFTMLT